MCVYEGVNFGPARTGRLGGGGMRGKEKVQPGHVICGSHRGAVQSETRGQRVVADVCFIVCAWGASLLNAAKSILKNQHQAHKHQPDLEGQRQQCAATSLGT